MAVTAVMAAVGLVCEDLDEKLTVLASPDGHV